MSPEQLNNTFSALADPTRRAILARLAAGETSVNELAEPFEMSLPAVTKHLKVLLRAGLISQGRQAQSRPCKLEAKPLQEIVDWIEQYRQFWEQRLDQLDAYLQQLQATENAQSSASQVVATLTVSKALTKTTINTSTSNSRNTPSKRK